MIFYSLYKILNKFTDSLFITVIILFIIIYFIKKLYSTYCIRKLYYFFDFDSFKHIIINFNTNIS